MRTIPPPGSKYVKDWVGKRIRTKVDMQNGCALVPAGAFGMVTGALSGLRIMLDRCGSCGLAVYLTKISPYNVEVLPEKCTAPPTGWECSRPGGHEGPCAARPTEPARKDLQHPDAGPRGDRYPFGDPQ